MLKLSKNILLLMANNFILLKIIIIMSHKSEPKKKQPNINDRHLQLMMSWKHWILSNSQTIKKSLSELYINTD